MSEQRDNSVIGYEKRDVNMLWVTLSTIFIFGLVVVFVVFLDSYYVWSKERHLSQARQQQVQQVEEISRQEAERLNKYDVRDAEKGIYQIPIDRAMELEASE
jgi:uncharacterized membrane protein SpoIIM required for sporulation